MEAFSLYLNPDIGMFCLYVLVAVHLEIAMQARSSTYVRTRRSSLSYAPKEISAEKVKVYLVKS